MENLGLPCFHLRPCSCIKTGLAPLFPTDPSVLQRDKVLPRPPQQHGQPGLQWEVCKCTVTDLTPRCDAGASMQPGQREGLCSSSEMDQPSKRCACVCVLLVYFASGTHDFCWGFPHLHPVPCPHLSSPVLLCPVVWPPWPTRWSRHHASKLLFWLLPLAGTSCLITKSWFCFKAEQKYHLPLCLPEPPQAKLSPPVLPNT